MNFSPLAQALLPAIRRITFVFQWLRAATAPAKSVNDLLGLINIP